MLLPIVSYDNPILRKKGVKHTFGDAEANAQIKQLAADMFETMYAAKGIGLAAQQVGQALMLCVIDIQQRADELDFQYILDEKTPPIGLLMPLVLVNPTLKLGKAETEKYEEGCLSFPSIRAEIDRPSALVCKYQDLEGVAHTLSCDGILARVIQHEVDHLNGILFIDRMAKSTLKKLWPQLEALKLK